MHFWTELYFFVCAFLAVSGALVTVVAPNPIRGAMGLLVMIVSIAGLFLALHAQFLAAIQLIVYAGAIVVLFLFVIMLLGPSATPPHDHKARNTRILSGSLFGLVSLLSIWLVTRGGQPSKLTLADADFGSIDQMGRTIFSYGVVPFELSSALLMVAVVGAIAVARGKDSAPKKRDTRGLTVTASSPGAHVESAHLPGDLSPGHQGGE
jgi:NADH-quinone oxidoreductase subunit J